MRLELDPKNFRSLTIHGILVDQGLDEAYINTLLWQGSVWHNKARIRDPNYFPFRANPDHLISVWKTQYPVFEFSLAPESVVYEDEALFVVYKPPRVNTSESVYSDLDCLTWGVQKHLGKGGKNSQINTIHRLDRDTQGLVLYAKTKEVEKYLYKLFMDRNISKRYLFAVKNPPQSNARTLYIDDSFEFKGKTEEALTKVIRLGQSEGEAVWYLAFPQTGKTHQIRKHALSRLGPLVGDQVYGEKSQKELHLACVGYRFVHPLTLKSFTISKIPSLESFSPNFWQKS